MKKNTIKQTIIAGFIGILGVTLFVAGFILTAYFGTSNKVASQPQKDNITLIKNVPTKKELTTMATAFKTKRDDKTKANTTLKDTTAPTIEVPEATVEQNTPVDVYQQVTATDETDGDLTAKITTDQFLDTSAVGMQTIHFSVTDSSGNTAVAERIFHIIPKSEANSAPVPEQLPVEQPAAAPTAEPVSAPVAASEPGYGAMTITMNGQTIPYQNGGQGSGQSIIDSNPGGVASTWGGAPIQSGDDGQNTHFIGHNPGIFATVFSLGVGSQIVVTDANGTPTTYTVRTLLQLDDYGAEVGSGTNYWDLTVGTGGGERITLQSCINDDINLFVIAYK